MHCSYCSLALNQVSVPLMCARFGWWASQAFVSRVPVLPGEASPPHLPNSTVYTLGVCTSTGRSLPTTHWASYPMMSQSHEIGSKHHSINMHFDRRLSNSRAIRQLYPGILLLWDDAKSDGKMSYCVVSRAPSQHKDGLCQVWGFPC